MYTRNIYIEAVVKQSISTYSSVKNTISYDVLNPKPLKLFNYFPLFLVLGIHIS